MNREKAKLFTQKTVSWTMQAPCGPCGGWQVEMYGEGATER